MKFGQIWVNFRKFE